MSFYICPHCGKSDYNELYSISTCVAWQPHYVNGVLVNTNPNSITTYCRCNSCGKEFNSEEFARKPQEQMHKHYCRKCDYLFFNFNGICPICKEEAQ